MATTLPGIFESMEYGPAPESDKRALAWIAEYGASFGHHVNGAWTKPAKRAQFDVINPATGEVIPRVAQGTKSEQEALHLTEAWYEAESFYQHSRVCKHYLYALARA